jgi:hypothetical protein
LLPPVWFWCEYVFLYPYYGQKLEEFKYRQVVASKIWLATVSVLLILYFGRISEEVDFLWNAKKEHNGQSLSE